MPSLGTSLLRKYFIFRKLLGFHSNFWKSRLIPLKFQNHQQEEILKTRKVFWDFDPPPFSEVNPLGDFNFSPKNGPELFERRPAGERSNKKIVGGAKISLKKEVRNLFLTSFFKKNAWNLFTRNHENRFLIRFGRSAKKPDIYDIFPIQWCRFQTFSVTEIIFSIFLLKKRGFKKSGF